MADGKMTSFLIEQKMSYINSTVNVCMLWWASSIVFCGSVLAAVWSALGPLRNLSRFTMGLGLVLFAFFSVIPLFGFLVASRLGKVQREIAVYASELLGAELTTRLETAKLQTKGGFFYTEICTFQRSMLMGAGSFALIHVAWILFWLYLMGVQEIWPYCAAGSIGSILWIGWLCRWLLREKEATKRLKEFLHNQRQDSQAAENQCVVPPQNTEHDKSSDPTAGR
ncbi:MAG TPA: hypothetical protein VF546_03990 [Pyrinomonadaceae bacterium]|jgi:hypothetical protein